MKTIALTVVMMALLTGCSGSSGGEDPTDAVSIIKAVNGALLNVQDPDTAQAAKPRIQHLTTRLREAAAASKKAGKTGPPAGENDRTAAAAQELTGNALRIKADPSLNGVLGADLDAFMNVMTGNG
jgi:hypothetical protein